MELAGPEFAAAVAQFGTAGLIGWMWLAERRAAFVREKQMGEAHDRLMAERSSFEAVLQALRDNTKALASLEVGQRELAGAIAGLSGRRVG